MAGREESNVAPRRVRERDGSPGLEKPRLLAGRRSATFFGSMSIQASFTLSSSAQSAVKNSVGPNLALAFILHRCPSCTMVVCPHCAMDLSAALESQSLGSSFVLRHSSFVIRHSSFVIRHSSFVIRHSSFVIRHSSFVIRHSSFVIRPWPLPPASKTTAAPLRWS